MSETQKEKRTWNRLHRRPRNPNIRIVHCQDDGGFYNRLRRVICSRFRHHTPRDIILLFCRRDELSKSQNQRLDRLIRDTQWTYAKGFDDLDRTTIHR